MATIKQLRGALVASIKLIKTANGYVTNTVDARVYDCYNQKKVEDKTDASYPKIFVIVENGVRVPLVSSIKKRDTNFLVVFISKQLTSSATPEATADIAEDFVDDMEKLSDRNSRLQVSGQSVEFTLNDFTTDSGFNFPEAVAICRVSLSEPEGATTA